MVRNDLVAFFVSFLAANLRETGLFQVLDIAADAACNCNNGIVTQLTKSPLQRESGVYCNDFNYYHISHRVHVEKEFGCSFCYLISFVDLWLSICQTHPHNFCDN